jgi:hypothetical protein
MDAQFIVKAIGPVGAPDFWVTTPRLHGLRTFGGRESAACFAKWDGAEHAIQEMRASEDCSEIQFEVEAIEGGKL